MMTKQRLYCLIVVLVPDHTCTYVLAAADAKNILYFNVAGRVICKMYMLRTRCM